MIKKRSLLDKLGGKTTTQLPAASVNSALGRSVGGYQPSIQPIQQPIIPKPILPSVNLSRPVTRDLGNPSLRESTQRENAKQSVIDAKLEKQTKQNASDRAKMLERQISDKYGIDVKRANSPIEAVNMLSMVDDIQKEQFKKDFAEYSFAAERSNPFRAGAEAGFNILPTNLEKTEGKEDVQTAKGYGAGRLVGGIGQQLAFNSVLGPGIESLTSKLLPKATPFVAETIKDVAIGTGTQLAEAPFDKPTAGQFAGNIALDIALNALFGVVGKGLSKVDLSNLKTAKPSQVVGDVAQKLNVSIVEADKVVDDAIDFYVNQSGVADTKPFEQLQLEAPVRTNSDASGMRLSEKVNMAQNKDVYLHSTNKEFENFKPSNDGFVYFSKDDGTGKTTADAIFSKNEKLHPKADKYKMLKVDIDESKINLFDPFVDKKAADIAKEFGLPTDRSYVKWDEIAGGFSEKLREEGYNALQVLEPDGKYSFAVSNMDAIKRIDEPQLDTPMRLSEKVKELTVETPNVKQYFTGSSNPNIKSFVPGGDGSTKTSGDSFGKGVYLTSNPEVAKSYAQGEQGKVYDIQFDNPVLDLDSKADSKFVENVYESLQVSNRSYKNRVIRDMPYTEKMFNDVDDAIKFLDEMREKWSKLDGEYSGNQPKANKKNDKFIVEYKNLDDDLKDSLSQMTNKEIFQSISAINTDSASDLVMKSGFDGVEFLDKGAFQGGIEGKTAVIYRNSDKFNIDNSTKPQLDRPSEKVKAAQESKVEIEIPLKGKEKISFDLVNATDDEIKSGLTKNISYDPNKKNEASYFNGQVKVGDKFFDLSPEGKKTVLTHEIAHSMTEELPKSQIDSMIEIFDDIYKNRLNYEKLIGDQAYHKNYDELSTDLITSYLRNPIELKAKYPDAYELAESLIEGKPISKTNIYKQLPEKQPIKQMSEIEEQIMMLEDVKAQNPKMFEEKGWQSKLDELKSKQLDRPSEFSIGAKYPPLAKDFARDVTKPARPRIEPMLKPIDRPSDFSVKKPIYPTLDPKFAKERPSVLMASDVKRIEPTLNVASKVDQPITTMKIEPTLKPKKQVETKQPSDAKMKFRKTITNSFQKSQLSDEAKIVFDENPREYEIYTNLEQWDKAFDKVSSDVDGSIKTFNSKSALENADDTAEGIALMNRLSSENRIDELINVADTFSERATNAGQAVQAIVMLQKTTPEGKLVQSINIVKNAKKQLESDMPDLYNKLKKDGKLPEITKDDAQFIVDQMKKAQELTGRARDIEIGKVDQLLANKIPATFGDKVRAIRNLSLLGNIKTVVTRNPLGNLIFAGLENLSQIPSGLTDKIVSNALKTTRTTKVLPSIGTQVKGFKKGFSEALSDIKLGIDTSPVRGGAELPRSKKVFEIALLNKANNWLGDALKLGDRPFYQAAYDLRLKELQELMPDADPKDLDLLAKEFGLSRTFQNDGSTSKAFKKVKDAFNTANIKGVGFGDVVMPYTQTPANILAKGVQYTPLNIIQIAKIASGGTENIARNQKAFVDAVGRTFIGSGIIALGYALAKNGYISGKNQDTSSKAKALKKDIGQQQYSIKIGDTWYSYDWAQPASIPLAVGVDFFNAGASEKDILTAIEKGSISGGETLLQQGLLQGVMRMFGGYSPIENVIETIGTSPTQFLPTLGNQTAQMKDEYKRDVNYKGSVGDQLLDLSKRRIPGVRETLPATLNMWGEPVKEQQGRTGIEKAFDVFVNPSLKSKESDDPILQEVNKVFKETKDTSVIPSYTPSALTSSDEIRNFKMIYGTMAKSELETLFRSSIYKGSREQNKLIKKVLDKLQDKAKDAYNLKYKTDLR